MAKKLDDCTTQELYNELIMRDDVFSIQLWIRNDVKEAFPDKTDDEIDEFISAKHGAFDDRCTEFGWEMMDALG